MGEALNKEKTIREYLLGRVSDETTLEGLEDLLFTDEEFCSQVALAEDGIINDYVLGRLNDADAESFRSTLANNPERRFQLELTQRVREKALAEGVKTSRAKPSLFASLQSFFSQPIYAGAFAVLLIAVVGLAIYFSRRNNPDELAELRSIYQRSRPTETRISEFGYAPLTQLRGAPESAEQNRLRRIENNLIEATEKKPNAQTHHALGVFYLTQRDYPKAIKEFEASLKFGDNAKIHNDLGAAHFERAKTEPKEKRLEELAQSLEEFTTATKLDGNLLEALFNKSLALQEMGTVPRQARDSWMLYLQKDPTSPWAEEARKNLTALENQQTLIKNDEQVLSDFLTAYRNHDVARAQNIHDETKGLLSAPALALQLSRRYLIARQRGDEVDAKESLAAMAFIGHLEQTQHSEFFFRN
jgi:tetratricopeptide (TPR) repeat protein